MALNPFGALIGALFSSLHAVATVNLRADHIVSGTVLNLMAPALGVFLLQVFYQQGQINISEQIGYWNVPLLSNIPVIGKIFFSQTSLPGFLAIVVAILAWYVLFKTRFGLRLRSVGENPQAADTLGINVYAYRWAGVLLSGVLGGVGGAIYAQAISGNFSVSTIAGQGFISLAAMILVNGILLEQCYHHFSLGSLPHLLLSVVKSLESKKSLLHSYKWLHMSLQLSSWHSFLEKQLRLRLMVLTTSNLNKFTKIKKSVDEQTFLLYF